MADDPLSLDFGSDKPFYVYLYRDPRPGKKRQPIYVGMGTVAKKRADRHWKKGTHNILFQRILDKIAAAGLAPVIEVVAWFDNRADACALECQLIARIGRRDLGAGPLSNLTDGGEAPLGISAESRKRAGAKLKNRKVAPEVGRRISEAKKGVKRPDNAERNRRVFKGKTFKMSLSTMEINRRREAGINAAKVNLRNLMPEAKARHALSLSEAGTRYWENLTDDEREARRLAVVRGIREKNGNR